MLAITQDAATLVRTLTEEALLPGGAGVRITIDPAHDSLSMALARGPESRDFVVVRQGARVFLTPAASERVQHRTLRADIGTNRSAFFLDAR